ncbi:glycosyl transferase family 90 [Polynucleobacter sp. MWH-UH25E]|uniref:glycosyl transferase family 90 n=1 Tax=Polynucleobacter sp. MWH-UH25E TaxID=1855616 RepID=UPI001BFE7130|nr:glycosyl transferase family 90 [Polynucleobacter sp. MWH-UH25E]QWD62304.1 hypothetical protein ICV39_01425 [Polynucleobacter sp. MWH-UH25E]
MNNKLLFEFVRYKEWDRLGGAFTEFAQPLKIQISEERLATIAVGIQWRLLSKDSCQFIFNSSIHHDKYLICVARLALILPLIKAFHLSSHYLSGEIFISLDDWAQASGLTFCSNRQDSVLIPDGDFLHSYGYRQTMLDFMVNSPPWAMRKPVAFWRGNTTGVRQGESWRDLPRIQLCQIARQSESQSLFDVGISAFAQVSKKEAKEIKAAGLVRDFVPITDCVRSKYQIDIDGNSNAWSGLFQKLLSGSTVLKVDSPNQFRQWYYDKLVPWVNFVPVKSDLSDLVDKVHWLIAHDDEAQKIGLAGKELALSLSYESELKNTILKINKALKHIEE